MVLIKIEKNEPIPLAVSQSYVERYLMLTPKHVREIVKKLTMRRIIEISVLFITIITLTSCGGDDGLTGPENPGNNGDEGNETPPLEITSLQPESGPYGTLVTIKGNGFQPEGEMNVSFGDSLATIDSATQDEIQTIVPEGIGTGSIQVLVMVEGDTASGPNFTVESKSPAINSVEPDSGTVGTEVMIKGMNFSATASENTIEFNGTAATVKSATKTELVTDVPQGATDGPIEVTVKQRSTTSPPFDVITDGTMEVMTETAGSDLDSNGYQLILDGGSSSSISINDKLYFNDLETGSYNLELTDIAENCSVNGSNPRTEAITPGDTTSTTFEVNCTATTNGKIAFSSVRDGDGEIYLMNPDGTSVEQLTDNSAGDFNPAISHDGTRIAFVSDRGTKTDIYIMDVDGSNVEQLTASDSYAGDPAWSPDDTQLAFTDDRNQHSEVFTISVNGNNLQQVTGSDYSASNPSWSPDGQKIAFHRSANVHYQFVIYTINPGGTDLNKLTVADNSNETEPAWSPDGSRILFRKSSDLWTMSSTGTDKTQLTSTPGKQEVSPSWSPDGQKIAFELNNSIYVMNAEGTATPTLIERSDVSNTDPHWGTTEQ